MEKRARTLGKYSLQVRYLSPFNVLSAPISSAINNGWYDEMRDKTMKAIIERAMTFDELADLFRKLRRQPRENSMLQGAAEKLAGR